jgi:hypothetical protein
VNCCSKSPRAVLCILPRGESTLQGRSHAFLEGFVDDNLDVFVSNVRANGIGGGAQDHNDFVNVGGANVVQRVFEKGFRAKAEELLLAAHAAGGSSGQDDRGNGGEFGHASLLF